MNLENCFVCKQPVLELEGQFEKLDTYLLKEEDEAYRENAFGWCHALCLSTSIWGTFWSERRVKHKVEVLGFPIVGESSTLTAVKDPRNGKVAVYRDDGVTFFVKPSALKYADDHPGGLMLPVSENMNLKLDDPSLADQVREALMKSGRFPIPELIKALGLTDLLIYPEAISNGALHFDKSLSREWRGNWVSAVAKYNQFIPDEIKNLLN